MVYRFILMFVLSFFAIFGMFIFAAAVLSDEVDCKNIQHYLSDFEFPERLKYVRVEDSGAVAVHTVLIAMGMKPPGAPAYYLFMVSSNNPAATVIVIFDADECFMANAGVASRTGDMILRMAFPQGVPESRQN